MEIYTPDHWSSMVMCIFPRPNDIASSIEVGKEYIAENLIEIDNHLYVEVHSFPDKKWIARAEMGRFILSHPRTKSGWVIETKGGEPVVVFGSFIVKSTDSAIRIDNAVEMIFKSDITNIKEIICLDQEEIDAIALKFPPMEG